MWEGCAAEAAPRAWLLERVAGHPAMGKEEPPFSIEGARAMFTGKYTAEDAQACKKLGGFRAGKLHHCLSASRPRGGLSCVVLCSALQLLLESSAPSSADVHTALYAMNSIRKEQGIEEMWKEGVLLPCYVWLIIFFKFLMAAAASEASSSLRDCRAGLPGSHRPFPGSFLLDPRTGCELSPANRSLADRRRLWFLR